MVKINKLVNKSKNIAKNAVNETDEALHDRKFNNSLKKVGKIAQKQVLPAVVSTAIPLASTALGAVATTYGGPMAGQMVQGMSQELMKQYIPDKYQSDNKYVNMFGDALNQGIGAMNGDIDPNAMMNLQNQFSGQVVNDLTKPRGKHKQSQYYPQPSNLTSNFDAKEQPQYQYQRPVYNPDNPYEDLIQQLMNKSHGAMPSQILEQAIDNNAKNDALYKGAQISNDNMTLSTPPFQQMEGNVQGLMGTGIKKKRGRPLKSDQVQRIQDKKTNEYNRKMKKRSAKYPDDDDYPLLTKSVNPSLDQYLGMHKYKEKRDRHKNLMEMLDLMRMEAKYK
jgi:hypothetical protein